MQSRQRNESHFSFVIAFITACLLLPRVYINRRADGPRRAFEVSGTAEFAVGSRINSARAPRGAEPSDRALSSRVRGTY